MFEYTWVVALIGSLGFPIVMCIWFMARTETVINNNTVALDKLKEVVIQCKKK